ncbi:hypothetical protein [Methanosphaerula palustris]|uniref:hypothetical protein n=1 Tax=Methanosphaerula palustris TaxID=475088 RepID=UPI001305173A|nr:hypothetical protein [Methanosphaerula palustris]
MVLPKNRRPAVISPGERKAVDCEWRRGTDPHRSVPCRSIAGWKNGIPRQRGW